MSQTNGKSIGAMSALVAFIVAACMALSTQLAGAAQLPANCKGNNLSYNVINQNGLVNVTNGTVVTFVSTIAQVSSPDTCNIVLSSTNGLTFSCPDANGNPFGPTTLLIPPSTVLPGGVQSPAFSLAFTNQCTISVNPGVHTAQVELTDGGAVVQDNPLQDDPAAILKTLSVNIFNPCIHVTKQCAGGPYVYGTPVSFVGTVTNCGDVVLQGVTVVDDQAGTLISGIQLQPGQGTNFSASYIPNNLCGPATNNVTATGIAPLSIPATVSSTASAVCNVSSSPCINVTKTCPGSIVYGTTSYVVSGVVTNCGNVPLVGVQVVDDNGTPGNAADDITITIGSIPVGGSAPWTATNTVAVGCGPFTDHVVASGAGLCGGAVSATNQCTTTVSSTPCINVTKACPASPLPVGTTSFQVSGVVTNCGNVPLVNVVVIDDNGTVGNSADDITIPIGSLPVGGSAPWVATNTVLAGFCGPVTDHVKAIGQDGCSGAGVTNSASCTTTILCPAPKICVTKGITCAPANGIAGCNSGLTYGSLAIGMAGTNQAAFCYQIIVSNCGLEPLTNVMVSDSLLPGVGGTFPPVLLPGQTVTNYYGQSFGLNHGGPSTNVNTVVAIGTGVASGITTNAQASATNIVVPASVSCGIVLFSSYDMDGNTNDNHVTFPAGQSNNTPVEFTLTINNTGQADLSVSLAGLPPLVDCGDDMTVLTEPAVTNIPAGGSVVIDGCMLVSCPGGQINVSVQGVGIPGGNIQCVYDSQGNVIKTAASSCNATVVCQQPVSCRVTGGGTLQPGNSDSNCIVVNTTLFDDEQPAGVVLDHISHGGQLGAPFSQQDCGEILGNPCIRGQWEHQRHYQGTGNPQDTIDADFHSATPKGVFDTLMCACLGCCGPTVDQPNGKFTGLAQKFTLCNPDDHRVCGPMPRPAPANAIIFTGIGTFTPAATGKNGKSGGSRYVIFRVYIEDRSEPGGNHPKGSVEPSDVYCFQAWDTQILTSKKPDYSTIATAFRQALAADSCAFIQSISTPSQIVNGVVVGGVPPGTLPSSTVAGVAADIVDQGPIWDGNQQIHPSTSATCTQ